MHRVGVLNGDGRCVFYEDGVFTLEGSGHVGPRQLLAWADGGVLAFEQPGMREWVTRRAAMSPSPTARSRSPRTAVAIVAGVTAALLVGGSVFGWMLYQSARREQSDRYVRLIGAQDERKDKADSAFRELSKQHPEVDVDAVVKAAEEAR